MHALPDIYVRAATLYIARESDADGECYRKGCDSTPVVALMFLAEHVEGETDEAYVYLCRTHLHGWLGHFLDDGEAVEVDDD
jgi:hypothetical protein